MSQVILPTGTSVEISLSGYQINVAVTASPADVEASEGLCGWYDGDVSNDLRYSDGTVVTTLGKRREADHYSNQFK